MEAPDYWSKPEAAAGFIRGLTSVEGQFDLLRATEYLRFTNILDVDPARGAAAVYFAMAGKQTTVLDAPSTPGFTPAGYPAALMDALAVERIRAEFHDLSEDRMYDAIWMPHVLQRTLDTGQMLKKAARLLNPNGWLMLTVPPYNSRVEMGRLSTGWNLGQLIHTLLVAGYNVRYGNFIRHGGSLCGFVQKGNQLAHSLPPGASELVRSAACFSEPERSNLWPMTVQGPFDGDLEQVNWYPDFAALLKEGGVPLYRMYYPAEAFQSRSASLANGRWRHTTPVSHQHFVYGPYSSLPPGTWVATWDVDTAFNSRQPHAVILDVAASGVAIAQRRMAPGEKPSIQFEHHESEAHLEFRIYADGTLPPGALSFGGVSLVRAS
ncbi:MAG: hypothetical protein IT161_11900 [Bryobacterales bacterium]|nr:hypothetical protein [Bryobacterales bacterium]